MPGLQFDTFSKINAHRNRNVQFYTHKPESDLPEIYWSNAIAGEAGELANLCKKRHLGKPISDEDVLREIADIVTYCDLLCTMRGAKLSDVLTKKFNEVSDRYNCDIKIPVE